MKEVVIVSGARTPIGTMGGAMKDVHAADLGAAAIKEAVARAGISQGNVDEVVFGNVGQVAENAFIARMCAIRAGLSTSSTALTVNRLCGSGLQAVNTAVATIRTGDAEVVVAGGTENMDLLPYYVRKARYGYRMGHAQLEDGLTLALSDPFRNYAMGCTAENLADRYGISRREQDEFALRSQENAIRAMDSGLFKDEIVPVEVPQRKGEPLLVDTDEHPRRDTSLEKLAKLKPAFREGGSVTAGNSSGINQGAAAVVIMSADKAAELGLKPMVRVTEYAVGGVDPDVMGIGPVVAVRKLLKKTGLKLDDFDLIELNEAFAAQSLAVIRELGLDPEKVNPNGGAIALGHPIGATGAILTVKAMYDMKRRGLRRALVTLCIGGGQGIATVLENCEN
jgi:acetyl-CoA C-acetyltransferase